MGAVLRITTLLSSVLLAPILLKVLSIELFGVWMLFSSIVGVLTFADFGLGNSLINELVSSDTAVKVKKQEYLVSSTFFLLLFLCLVLLISGLVFTLTLDLKTVFNIQSDISSRQLNIVFMIFIGSFALFLIIPIFFDYEKRVEVIKSHFPKRMNTTSRGSGIIINHVCYFLLSFDL